MTKQVEVNWDYWLKLKAVEPWEACALSLDIDPDTMWPDKQGYLVGPGALPMYGEQPNEKTISTLVEFNLRLKRLNRDMSTNQSFTFAGNGKLALTRFVEWLRAMGIDHIPIALAELHPTPEEQAQWNEVNTWLDENPHIDRRLTRQIVANDDRRPPKPELELAEFDAETEEQHEFNTIHAWVEGVSGESATRSLESPAEPDVAVDASTTTVAIKPTKLEMQWIDLARAEIARIRDPDHKSKLSNTAISNRVHDYLKKNGIVGRGGKIPSAETIRRTVFKKAKGLTGTEK